MKIRLTFLLALVASGVHAQTASLTWLAQPATALSADGRTVLTSGSWYTSPGGYLVSDLGATPLDLSPYAFGLSANGRVVAGGWWSGYRYADGVTTKLPGLAEAAYGSSRMSGISGDGRVAFGLHHFENYNTQAAYWDASGVPHSLGLLPGRAPSSILYSEARAASYDGSTLVGMTLSPGNYRRAFRWTAATGMVDLGTTSGARESAATAVSGDGRTVFGASYDYQARSSTQMVNQAFRWTAATGLTPLDGLGDVTAVTPDGRFAVGRGYAATWGQLPRRVGIDSRPPHGWNVVVSIRLWDARTGTAVDLNALTAPYGLETLVAPDQRIYAAPGIDDSQPMGWNLYSRPISGVAYDAGRVTVVGTSDGKGFRLVLPYDPAPLRIATTFDAFRGDPTALPVTVELRRAGAVVQRATVFPEADGRVVVNAPAAGTYDVSLSAPRFLRRTLKGVALSGGPADLSASLVGGDVDGNGVVNATDRARVTLALGTALGQPGFAPLCDLDGNGVVNATDRALVTARLGRVGDL